MIRMGSMLVVVICTLTSCATRSGVSRASAEQFNYEKIKVLEDQLNRLYYFQAHDSCFTHYAVCMGEKGKECFKKHEQCIIQVDRQYRGKI